MPVVETPARRPGPLRDLGLTAALFAVAMALVAAGALTFVHPDAFLAVALGGWLLAVLAFVAWLSHRRSTAWMFVFGLVSFFVMLTPAFVVQEMVLGVRGEPVRATVVAVEQPAGDGDGLVYTLAGPSGERLPGLLEAHDGFTVGSVVDVVADPRGLVRPQLAAEVVDGTVAGGVCTLLLFHGVLLLFAWFVIREKHRAAPEAAPADAAAGTPVPAAPSERADDGELVPSAQWAFLTLPIGRAFFVLVLAAGAVFVLIPGVGHTYAKFWGVPGRVAVASCDEHFSADAAGFTCHGAFSADDGTVIDRVTLAPDLPARPTAPVPARVAGASSTEALTDAYDAWATQLFGGLAMAGIALFALVTILRQRRINRDM
ncbi:hypothetical protein [Catellatospora sp. NPDC049609]|uniref:hypothetical protein n=1 Tax=Catellatospora sp. NPDC049609 TaxID=3155505 RepID=UPI0034144D0A